jgi:hypothetical protein
MDESRRYLRYVIPGLTFFIQLFILLWFTIPDWTKLIISNYKGIEFPLFTLLGATGIGFIFSTIYHQFLWRKKKSDKIKLFNFKDLIKCLVKHRKLIILMYNCEEVIKLDNNHINCIDKIDRYDAWSIVNGIIYEKSEKNEKIKGSLARIDSLTNTFHSTGIATVSTIIASLIIIIIVLISLISLLFHKSFYFNIFGIISGGDICIIQMSRIIITIFVTIILLYCHINGCNRIGLFTQKFIEQVVLDALTEDQILTRILYRK